MNTTTNLISHFEYGYLVHRLAVLYSLKQAIRKIRCNKSYYRFLIIQLFSLSLPALIRLLLRNEKLPETLIISYVDCIAYPACDEQLTTYYRIRAYVAQG